MAVVVGMTVATTAVGLVEGETATATEVIATVGPLVTMVVVAIVGTTTAMTTVAVMAEAGVETETADAIGATAMATMTAVMAVVVLAPAGVRCITVAAVTVGSRLMRRV